MKEYWRTRTRVVVFLHEVLEEEMEEEQATMLAVEMANIMLNKLQ
jgi:hypothetical protein